MTTTKVNLANTVEGILPVANGGTGSSTGVSPGGSTTQVQFNNAGAFGGSANLTFDGTTLTAAGLTDSGNLTFTGTGNRITGDFSNATIANRVLFQSSTTNGNSLIEAIPNGTAVTSAFSVSNATDPENTSIGNIFINSTSVRFQSEKRGTGTYLPITMHTSGGEKLRIDTSGNVLIGNSTDPLGGNRLLVQSAATANNNRTFSVYNTAATSTTAFANRLVQISSNGSGADATLHFSDQVANNAYFGMGSGALYFATGGTTERMRIDSTGALGFSGANYGTSGQVLTSNGSGSAPSWQAVASGQGGRGQVFTSSGTFTIPTGVTALKIIVVGAGGGGNGGWGYLQDPDIGGGGGGGGGTAISYLTGLTPGGTLAVTIGAGGAAKGTYGGSGAGNAGGNSTVASGTQSITTITGGGGAGALQTSSPRPGRGGAGGTATNGTINISGGAGGDGSAWSNSISIGGCGGASLLSGNVAPPNTSGSGDTGLNYGGGGAGGSTADTNTGGGAGANGIVIFEW